VRLQKIFLVVFFLFFSYSSYPWGQTGHRVVGGLAQKHLSSKAKKKVSEILNGYSLADVSTWMDEIKSEKTPNYRSMYNWHFQDMQDLQSWNPEVFYADSGAWPRNLYESLVYVIGKLRNHGQDDHFNQNVYLRMLVHLVADAHQPLHVGNGLDLGGNRCYVKWFYSKWPTTLHAVWDSKIIDSTKYSYTEYVDYLDHVDTKTKQSWMQDDIQVWLKESRKLHTQIYPQKSSTQDRLYCSKDRKMIQDKDIPVLSYAYIYQMRPIVDLRLQQAGIRLAAVINSIFS